MHVEIPFASVLDPDRLWDRYISVHSSMRQPRLTPVGHSLDIWGDDILVHAGSDYLHKRCGGAVWTKTCSFTSLVPIRDHVQDAGTQTRVDKATQTKGRHRGASLFCGIF